MTFSGMVAESVSASCYVTVMYVIYYKLASGWLIFQAKCNGSPRMEAFTHLRVHAK
jgi:hypothetical protein